jgi:lipopolysaccharide assembly outer membrane protein LptD (OstA)
MKSPVACRPGEQQAISLSVANNFEMKTMVDPTDTTSKEQKIQLLNLTGGLSYNFAADSLKFSPLSLRATSQIGEWLSFQGGSTFSLYQQNPDGNPINKYMWETGRTLRLTNFDFSISTSLSGERLKSTSQEEIVQPEDQYQLGESSDSRIYKGLYEEKQADFTIPWDISLSYNYSYTKTSRETKTSNLQGGLNFNLTPNWKFSFSGHYDINNKLLNAPEVRISRDLHCWIMNFTWRPIGAYRGYNFEIRVKAPQLQDLKITKRDQFFSGR